jgi:hypothetical protein
MPTVHYRTVRSYEFRLDHLGNPQGVARPMLPVRLIGQRIGPELLALVDSGADRSLFHADIAPLVGIDLDQGRRGAMRGVGGIVDVWSCRIGIEIERRRFEIEANFTDDPGQRGRALLGRLGIFSEFQFGFDQRAGELLIEPYP